MKVGTNVYAVVFPYDHAGKSRPTRQIFSNRWTPTSLAVSILADCENILMGYHLVQGV